MYEFSFKTNHLGKCVRLEILESVQIQMQTVYLMALGPMYVHVPQTIMMILDLLLVETVNTVSTCLPVQDPNVLKLTSETAFSVIICNLLIITQNVFLTKEHSDFVLKFTAKILEMR